MENVRQIPANPLPETSSAPNVTSPHENHSHDDSSTDAHEKVESDGATLHQLGDSSDRFSLQDGNSLPSESSVYMAVLASETSKTSEAITSCGIFLVEKDVSEAKDNDSFDLQKDGTLTDILETSPFISDAKTTDAAQESLHKSPIKPADGPATLSESVPSGRLETVAKHVKHRSLDNLGSLLVHDNATPLTPRVGGYEASKRAAESAFKISRISSGALLSADSPMSAGKVGTHKGHIDTTAPFESVKHAVSMFGGIADLKARRVHSMEKRKVIGQELYRAQSEIPSYKKKCEAAEDAKVNVLNELDNTTRLIEELKLNLEKVQIEEHQAKQDAELAALRVEEMELGIDDEASTAVKAQLEVAKTRYAAAISEQKTVKEELEVLRKDYALLVTEKDAAVKKAEEAVSASKEAEKTVEDLTNELITAREALESAHAAHLEAEEHRLGAEMAWEQDALNWEKQLKQEEEKLERLNQESLSTKDLNSKLDIASSLLKDLKSELAAYMESKLKEETEEVNFISSLAESKKRTHLGMQAAVASAERELEEVKLNIEKATYDVDCLKVAATSLKSELEKEKAELATVRQRQGMASVVVSSLEVELDRVNSEIVVLQAKVKEARDKMEDLPKRLQEAAHETDQAKLLAQAAREDLWKAKEEAEQAKAGASTVESKLIAAKKETEAAKASEKLALAAINALLESESAQSANDEDSPTAVTLSFAEYYMLSKQARDAEDEANNKVAAAMSQIEVAKESEMRKLNKLEVLIREMEVKKEALHFAVEKAEKAKVGKLGIEQELRKWRAEHVQRRKEAESGPIQPSKTTRSGVDKQKESKNIASTPDSRVPHLGPSAREYMYGNYTETESSPEVKVTKKKKRSFFPRIFMFLSKKKSQAKSA